MSDILIRGMGMPSSCYECPCVTTVDIDVGIAYGCVFCKAMMYDPSERLDECPLVELPEHGRLIDVDAIPRAAWRGEKEDLIDELILAPTIIPASGGDEE